MSPVSGRPRRRLLKPRSRTEQVPSPRVLRFDLAPTWRTIRFAAIRPKKTDRFVPSSLPVPSRRTSSNGHSTPSLPFAFQPSRPIPSHLTPSHPVPSHPCLPPHPCLASPVPSRLSRLRSALPLRLRLSAAPPHSIPPRSIPSHLFQRAFHAITSLRLPATPTHSIPPHFIPSHPVPALPGESSSFPPRPISSPRAPSLFLAHRHAFLPLGARAMPGAAARRHASAVSLHRRGDADLEMRHVWQQGGVTQNRDMEFRLRMPGVNADSELNSPEAGILIPQRPTS